MLMRLRSIKPQEYSSYQRRDQEGKQGPSKEAGGFSTSGNYWGNLAYIFNYCSTEGHGARR